MFYQNVYFESKTSSLAKGDDTCTSLLFEREEKRIVTLGKRR